MKKIVIISFAFFILALSGCAKSEEDKCKDKGKYWDASAKECKERTPGGGPAATTTAETKETCEAKPGIWNANNSTCKVIDYFMVIHPEDYDSQTGRVYYVVRVEKDLVDYKPSLTAFSDKKGLLIKKGDCIKVHKLFLSNTRVQVRAVEGALFRYTDVCNNIASDASSQCQLGVYEIMSGSPGLKRVHPTGERTNCRVLELEE